MKSGSKEVAVAVSAVVVMSVKVRKSDQQRVRSGINDNMPT